MHKVNFQQQQKSMLKTELVSRGIK